MTEIRAPYAGRTLPVGTTTERDLRDEIAQLRVQIRELDTFNNDLLGDVARLKAQLAQARDFLSPFFEDESPPDGWQAVFGLDP